MGLQPRLPIVSGLCATAALLAGCGSTQGLLSAHAHGALSADFVAVTQAVAKGSCPDTKDAIAELRTTLDGLPSSTNAQLVGNLNQGQAVLRRNALRDCRHHAKPPPATTSTTTTSTSSSETSSTTESTPTVSTTETTPPPTTPTSQTATTPPPTNTTPPPTDTNPVPPVTTTSNGGSGLGGQ